MEQHGWACQGAPEHDRNTRFVPRYARRLRRRAWCHGSGFGPSGARAEIAGVGVAPVVRAATAKNPSPPLCLSAAKERIERLPGRRIRESIESSMLGD